MITSILSYLLESSVCFLFFAIVYKVLLSKLTHFTWMRIYLLAGMVLSLFIPCLHISTPWFSSFHSIGAFNYPIALPVNQPEIIVSNNPQLNSVENSASINWGNIALFSLFFIYITGFFIKACFFMKNIRKIFLFISKNPQKKENQFHIVSINDEIPAFSFFNFIFINDGYKKLTKEDLSLIKKHELTHAKEYHSLDIILVELTSIAFWFNPAIRYFKHSLQEVHEYIVDKKTAGKGENKKVYAELLLNLVSEKMIINLSAGFTGKQLNRRVQMLAKPRTSGWYKGLFFVFVPVLAFLLLSFSINNEPNFQPAISIHNTNKQPLQYKIGRIIWENNYVFSNDTLNKLLGVKRGDLYDIVYIDDCLRKGKVGSLYYDNGYVFYVAEFNEIKKPFGEIDIKISIYEGMRGKIGTISFEGNKTVPDDEIRKYLLIKSGDLFNRTKIINSVNSIVKMGKFEEKSIEPVPIPNKSTSTNEFATIDLLFKLKELTK